MALISVVVPVYNEGQNVLHIHAALERVLQPLGTPYEIIFVNDGSVDDSGMLISTLSANDPAVRLVDLSRNFGKEIALTAGLHASNGDATLTIDADGQHPPALIPLFLEAWRDGAEVVIGVRTRGSGESLIKRFSSWLYYRILNSIAETPVVPRSTDFRLLDRCVVDEYRRFTERNRIARGLIDWLGFRRKYVWFTADHRAEGKATYSFPKLARLALDSFVSLSLFPLKVAGYLGAVITLTTIPVAAFVVVEKWLLNDPFSLRITGTAALAIILVLLVGIILGCLGLIALYIANIHTEVINRPLYVTRSMDSSERYSEYLRRSSGTLREARSGEDHS